MYNKSDICMAPARHPASRTYCGDGANILLGFSFNPPLSYASVVRRQEGPIGRQELLGQDFVLRSRRALMTQGPNSGVDQGFYLVLHLQVCYMHLINLDTA